MKRSAIMSATVCAMLVMARPFAEQQTPRLALELEDYAALPVTADNTNENTRAQLARVNNMREEPGGRRFFVNDLNGPLYIIDKQTKKLTTYLDFNGVSGRPGLFAKLTFERNFATGLTNFVFDPDYSRNGVLYTLHMEDPAVDAPALPKGGVVAGLDLIRYTTTPAITTPTVNGRIEREVVLVEWKDRNPLNDTFEGSARELLRVQHPMPIHPLGEMTFNPAARPGDADWRVMYLGAGDAGSGEQRDSRRLNPQRLDALTGKILRIIPDLREHATTSTVSENGRYRIPNDNPFAAMSGARKEIWAYGLRNPHRLIWDVDPARPRTPTLWPSTSGSSRGRRWSSFAGARTTDIRCARATKSMSSTNGMGPLPERDMIPVQISDTVTRGEVGPTYPVIQYPHDRDTGGDAIANGFMYRGSRIPLLRNKLVFGDITTGRIWYANRTDVLAADDGNATTVAPIHEMDVGMRRITEETFRKRGGKSADHSRNGHDRWSGPSGSSIRAGQRRRAVHPDQERRHDQEDRRRKSDDCPGTRGERSHESSSSERRRSETCSAEQSSGIKSRLGRRWQASVRHELRGLPREPRSGSGQSGHAAVHHRGAARQAAAGSHRRRVGSRLERRRHLPCHQARSADDHDAGIRWARSGPGHLEHRPLSSQPPPVSAPA